MEELFFPNPDQNKYQWATNKCINPNNATAPAIGIADGLSFSTIAAGKIPRAFNQSEATNNPASVSDQVLAAAAGGHARVAGARRASATVSAMTSRRGTAQSMPRDV